MLEDVCICNNGILEAPTLQDPLQQVASSNTTIISSKLICYYNRIDLFIQHLLEIIPRDRLSDEDGRSALSFELAG